jgi:hypothetical protein
VLLLLSRRSQAGNVATITKVVDTLNAAGDFPANTGSSGGWLCPTVSKLCLTLATSSVVCWAPAAEVVVAPSAIHIGLVAGKLRQDVKVAAQDIHTAKVG